MADPKKPIVGSFARCRARRERLHRHRVEQSHELASPDGLPSTGWVPQATAPLSESPATHRSKIDRRMAAQGHQPPAETVTSAGGNPDGAPRCGRGAEMSQLQKLEGHEGTMVSITSRSTTYCWSRSVFHITFFSDTFDIILAQAAVRVR